MKTVDVLIKARKLITNESNYDWEKETWSLGRITGSIYKNAAREDVLKLSDAVCFCSLGALNAAVGADAESYSCGLYPNDDHGDEFYRHFGTTAPTNSQRRAYWSAVKYLTEAFKVVTGNSDIVAVNDSHNHQRVLECFDLAIKNAKRRHLNGKRYSNATRRVCLP